MEDYDTAIRIKPGFAKALMNRGILRLEIGLHADAERDFAEAVRIDPRLRTVIDPFPAKQLTESLPV